MGDYLDAQGKEPNLFTGRPLGQNYAAGASIWANLPMYTGKAKLKELISSFMQNQVTIISSGTGSGKTVIVPKLCAKILKNANIRSKVAVTNPKAASTISNAETSALWAEVVPGEQIGYLTREAKATSGLTSLEYLTDGFLLSLSRRDPSFSKYTFLCLDEVHERPVNTDMLLLNIRSALTRRKDLRLILMSATIEEGVFADYFKKANLSTAFVSVHGVSNYPIESRYISKTPGDNEYLGAAVKVVEEILKGKPKGNILVFVPTSKDCADGCAKLPKGSSCFPLHSKLDARDKEMAIAQSPDGSVKIIFATNLAESSITFKGLDYVIDSGKMMTVKWDPVLNARIAKKEWVSKPQAKQRIGRAGRQRPGFAYHLYTEKDEKAFSDVALPKIHEDNPMETLFAHAASEKHLGDWTGAMVDARNLITPPTEAQFAMMHKMIDFYRLAGPYSKGGRPPTDASIASGEDPAPTGPNWRLSAAGWGLYDISRVFRTALENSMLLLAAVLYGAGPEMLKVVAILEETGGDLNALWVLDDDKKPVSLMTDPRINDPVSDHQTLANLFDSLGTVPTDPIVTRKVQMRHEKMSGSLRNFRLNREDEIRGNWPWCISIREPEPSVRDAFMTSVLVARMMNLCEVGAKTAKAVYLPAKLKPIIALKGMTRPCVVVCEGFASDPAAGFRANIATAFAPSKSRVCG